jgi:ABC-type lipoprotein export system ATPase subunit
LHEKLNATILIVTHDPGFARICSRTIALADARVVADYRNDSERP